MSRIETGRIAEAAVQALLVSRGFAIVGTNVRIGRLELDVIARRGALLVVCEVRSRRGSLIDPALTFDVAKQARVRQAALRYWASHARGCALRIDAAAVTFGETGTPTIRYFENVFV